MFKKCLVPILLIFLLMSIVVIGAPTYVNIGPTTDFEGDVGVPTGKGYYINDVQITSDALSDVAYIAMLDEAETITGNWVNTDNPWADDEVANNITIDLATLATTFTCTDNENEDLNCPLVFVDGPTDAQGAETDGDLHYNPLSGTLSATKFSGDGSELTNIGEAAATSLSFVAKEENTGNIIKGQPVYISGALAPAFPKIGLADCDDAAKVRLVGLAGEDIDQNTSGLVRRAGLLTGIDTLGANPVNPDDETWIAGDLLYVHTTTGGLTHTKPTSGRIIKAAYSLYGSNNSDDLLVITHENPVYIACAPDEDIIFRMGDALGVKKVCFKDYANVEVACVDSDGGAEFNSLILDTVLAVAEGGTNSGTVLNNDRVMVSSGGAIVEGVVTVTELGRLDGLGGIIVTDVTACTDIEGTGLAIAGGVLNMTVPAGHIKESMLDADAVDVGDILTYDDGGVDFLWKTKAELNIQPLDTALTNISALVYVSPSFIKLTANDTYAVRTIAEMKTDLSFMTDLVDDTSPSLGGQLQSGAHSINFTEQVLTPGTAVAWDLGNSNKATLTPAQNFTITITAPSGALNAQLIITQDGTGSRVMDEIVTQKDEAIATEEVHTDTEIIDLTIDIPTGARIRFKTSAADLPAPLVVDTIYYAIRSSENHIQVATTKAYAIAGTPVVDLTDAGTGTHTVQQLVKWTDGTLGVLTTAAGSEDIMSLTYKTADKQWYAMLANDFY